MIKSLWMLVASLLFALMAAFARMGASDFSALELVFYRSAFGAAVIALWVWAQGFTLRTPLVRAHFMRSFLGTFALTIWFYAAVVLGFFGVTLVLKPELSPGQTFPALVGLTSGFFAALAYFQIRQLSRMQEPEWRIVFYFTLFGTVWGLCGHLLLAGGMTPVTWDNAPALLGMAVTATGAQLAMTRSWGSANTLLTAVFQYSAIVFAAGFGLSFFDEPVGLMSAAGIAVILVSGVWAAVIAKKKS